MNRRDTLLGMLALGAGTAIAQPGGGTRSIGVLSPDTPSTIVRDSFSAALKKAGLEEGRNLAVQWRWANGKYENLPALAAELVRLRVELIVARTTVPILAAKAATSMIPIVMLNGNYPVELGIVQSLARPGGNITGTTYVSAEFNAKLLQLLKEIAPKASHVAVPWSDAPEDRRPLEIMRNSLDGAAARLGMKLQYFKAAVPDEAARAIDKIGASQADSILFPAFPAFRVPANRDRIVALGARKRIPVVSDFLIFADHGGLAHFGPDLQSIFERTASFVERILNGAKPADLPVEQPTKFELAINLKTAKALGITIPQSILLRADRVVE